MTDQQLPPDDPEGAGEGSYASHPVLSQLPRDVRQRIAEQIEQADGLGAAKTLRSSMDMGWWRAQQVIGEIVGELTRSPSETKLASGRIDKSGTTLTIYADGTFSIELLRSSPRDRLVGFSSELDSMRRKSVTGRGAAAIVTGGMSLVASNNRGVVYVTVTGERSGVKTYTTRNPEDKLLSTVRSLQAAADQLLASPPAVVTPSEEITAPSTQHHTDVGGQLKTLSDLHASGALSDEEFAAAKTRLLS
jgi:hypothetical protein